jgi:hypothetical protein
LKMSPAHAADADDRLGQLVTGREKSWAAEDAARDDHQGPGGQGGALDELPPGYGTSFHSAVPIYTGKAAATSRHHRAGQGFFSLWTWILPGPAGYQRKLRIPLLPPETLS